MKEIKLPGATWCDNRPDGYAAATVFNQHMFTPNGIVPLCPGGNLMYTVVAPEGPRFAGKGNGDDTAWEWDGNKYVNRGICIGENPIIYDNAGNLYVVSKPGGPTGSQGYRYIADSGGPMFADWSMHDESRRIFQYITRKGRNNKDIVIGQGGEGTLGQDPCIFIDENGVRRLISNGTCKNIHWRYANGTHAIAFRREDLAQAWMLWFTDDELHALPVSTDQPKPPTPKPPKPPDTPMPVQVPNMLATIKRVRAKYPTPLGLRHPALLAEVMVELKKDAPQVHWGLYRKGGGAHITMPSGVNVNQNLACAHQMTELWTYDFLGSAETKATPAWLRTEPTGIEKDIGKFYDLQPIDIAAIGGTPDQPPAQTTHKYVGGGNDTGICDQCKKPRTDPIHAIPESKVPHTYDGGEQDTGLCDICQQPPGAAIHKGTPKPPDGPGQPPQPGGVVSPDPATWSLLQGLLQSNLDTVSELKALRVDVANGMKELAKVAGGLGGILPGIIKKPTKKSPAKRKRR